MPSTVTSIGERAFENSGIKTIENFENCQITKLNNKLFNAAAIETIKIPKTVTEINTAFMSNSNLKLVYIPNGVTVVADTFTSPAANVVFLYTGNDTSIFADCATLASANKISVLDYDPNKTYTGINLVVGYSHCVAYNNGVHGVSKADLLVTSYLEAIKVVNTCEDCKVPEVVREIPALFVSRGFSAPENGEGGVDVSFTVNQKAIDEYEALSGKTVNFGLFVATQKALLENDVFGENQVPSDGVFVAAMNENDFAFMRIKIVGFETADQKTSKFAFGAYVTVDSDVFYLQEGTATDGSKYVFTSFNDIVTIVNNKNNGTEEQ